MKTLSLVCLLSMSLISYSQFVVGYSEKEAINRLLNVEPPLKLQTTWVQDGVKYFEFWCNSSDCYLENLICTSKGGIIQTSNSAVNKRYLTTTLNFLIKSYRIIEASDDLEFDQGVFTVKLDLSPLVYKNSNFFLMRESIE